LGVHLDLPGPEEKVMKKITAIAVSTAAVAALTLDGGAAMGSGGGGSSSGTWPAGLPLPMDRGTLLSQSSTTAVVRSLDTVATVQSWLDSTYVGQKGCTRRLAVNRPRDYLCRNASTGKTDEVWFTFAALDVTASNPYRSQTNGFYVKG
jgi:hypothetical protein